ncbi:MAG: hypothetical protein ACR2N4_11425 [Jatrophihabitans sp.]
MSLPVDRYALILGAISLAQAGWLGFFGSRGWFYADDLPYLSDATGRRLGWGYLSAPLNDHFVPGLRLVFWLLNRTTGLDYGVTVGLRVLLQAGATLLLARLLVLLVGRRPGVLAVVGWYAFGPLLMPGSVWLATSVHLLPSQVLVILAIDLHVRYAATGRLRLAVASTGCLLGALLFWELTGLTVLLLPIISLGFVHSGSLRQRLAKSLRRWPGWLILGVVLAGWLAVFVSGPYGGSARSLGVPAALHELRVGWFDAVGPALLGGPWRWFYTSATYYPVANPPLALIIVAQALILAVLLLALGRTGSRALLAWSMPLLVFVIGTVVVAVGRYQVFGDLTPRSFNYAFTLAVPVSLAAALSLLPSSAEQIVARANGTPLSAATGRPRWTGSGMSYPLAAPAAVLFLVSSLISTASFDHRWQQNPSQKYVQNLITSVRAAGPAVNIWDSRVPTPVIAFLSEHNHVSDILQLAGVPARFDAPATDPLVVRQDGTLAPGVLVPVATGVQAPHTPCTTLVHGRGSWSIPLSVQPGPNEYFVKISYLQQKPSVLYLAGRDKSGQLLLPAGGERTQLNDQLGNLYLRLPFAAPHLLTVRSDTVDADVCIGVVTLGAPFPQTGK